MFITIQGTGFPTSLQASSRVAEYGKYFNFGFNGNSYTTNPRLHLQFTWTTERNHKSCISFAKPVSTYMYM